MKSIIRVVVLFFIVTCTYAKEVDIKSNVKGGEITVIDPDSGYEQDLGVTPAKIPIATIKKYIKGKESFMLMIKKDGFLPFTTIIPVLSDTEVAIYANLRVEQDIRLGQDIDLMVTDLFDVLRMIRLKDYTSAVSKLDLLEKKFPHFSIIYEMKATGYYLSREFKKALNYYRKAFGLNPKNREAYKMKNYLEKKFNLSKSGS